MDIASSIQVVIENVAMLLANNIRKETKVRNLCLAGGVALNCVVNGKIMREKFFDNIWIQPASGDAGPLISTCLLASRIISTEKLSKDIDSMKGSLLGPKFNDKEIEVFKKAYANFKKYNEETLLDKVASELKDGKIAGVPRRMEFGPRALGCRSIIADPRSEKMQNLNLKLNIEKVLDRSLHQYSERI